MLVIGGLIGGTIGFGIGVFSGGIFGAFDMDSPLEVTWSVPADTRVGQPFDLTLEVRNTSTDAIKIETLDFYEDLVESCAVQSISHGGVLLFSDFGYEEYEVSGTIAGGAVETITVTLTPERAGLLRGSVEVWDEDYSYTSVWVQFNASEP